MAKKKANEATAPVLIAYKGFDANLRCRDFQYAIGESYEHTDKVEVCSAGFHACEYPLDVFTYYAPASSNYTLVEQAGILARHVHGDSKVASSKIKIKAEIGISALVTATFEFVNSRCYAPSSQHATGYQSASSATGDRSASSATGDYSASSATGYRSASSATGDRSASSATGYQSASSATGYQSASSATGYYSASSATGYYSASSATGDRSASSATGYQSASLSTGSYSTSEIKPDVPHHAVAIAAGYAGKARAPEGSAIVLVHRGNDGVIIHIRATKIGENGVRPNTWYCLNADGEFEEVPE